MENTLEFSSAVLPAPSPYHKQLWTVNNSPYLNYVLGCPLLKCKTALLWQRFCCFCLIQCCLVIKISLHWCHLDLSRIELIPACQTVYPLLCRMMIRQSIKNLFQSLARGLIMDHLADSIRYSVLCLIMVSVGVLLLNCYLFFIL